MPLHILQLGPYPPPNGGVTRNMLAIREELLAAGHSCSIVATSRSSRVIDEPNVYHPRSTFALLKLLKRLKFDILHLHIGGDVSSRVLALAFVCTYFGRRKTVLTLHSGAYPTTATGRGASPGSIRGLIFRRFSRIIAVNGAIADVFRRSGVPNDRIAVIPPYSLKRPDEKVNVPASLADFKKKHFPFLLAVGGLEKEYDPLLQIAAMEDVMAEFPNVGLMIVGDGSMRGEVGDALAASGYDGCIMLAGNIEHSVVLHLIACADILLRTTLFDGDAISIREALFLGTPVIATDTGNRPDGVQLIPVGDKYGLIKQIRLLTNAERKERHTLADDNRNIAEVLEVYVELSGTSTSGISSFSRKPV